uniref:Uncharacterized protein n=1 Tax=Meloidogyne enterolobii TaxID=390850 RepID=A0A6V7UZI5_MELEN|nr:unnamed protein product [Meloidogyne enterolobii]
MEMKKKMISGGTSALSSHMSTVHCQKSRRVILCRCCNLAFRDKNELHKHLKNRNNLPNDGTSSEDVLLPTIENHHPPNSPENNQTSQHENTNGEQIEKINNSKNSSKIQVVESSNRTNENVEDNSTITSAYQLLQQQQQHFILANLWSNIFSRQQTEQNTQENTTINVDNCNNENGMNSIKTRFLITTWSFCNVFNKTNEGVNIFNCLNSSCSTSSNHCSSSSSSSSSVIVQTTKIATNKTSTLTSPSIINSSSPTDSENDLILTTNTHSIINTNHRPEQTSKEQQCVQCALLKPKLLAVNERSTYLEACNTTFQNELIRLNAKCLLAEQCIRRLELELRQWRERNEVLRYRLLECREKALAVIGGTHINGAGGSISTADLSTFLGEMLKITLI